MNGNLRKIAYIAPEIPALSATFVYNEMLHLMKMGVEIVPVSIHVPTHSAQGKGVDAIAEKVRYLYTTSVLHLVFDSLHIALRHPIRFIRTFIRAISDALNVGIVTHTGIGLLYRFIAASRAAVIISEEGCTHIHVHFAHVPTDIAMYASLLCGVPFSFTSHANDLFERGWLLREKVERSAFAVTISDFNRRFLAGLNADKDKINVIHCGVDSNLPVDTASRVEHDVPVIGALGRFVEKKGFDVLVRACAKLREEGIAFRLTIAGDGPLKSSIEELAGQLKISDSVDFPGAIPHDDVQSWLNSIDIFALPCRKDSRGDMDGIPVVLMEAMLSGVPVVSTRLSGIPELIEHGKTGLLTEPDDVDKLASVLTQLMTDESLTETLRINAKEKIHAEFDSIKNVRNLYKLIEGVRL